MSEIKARKYDVVSSGGGTLTAEYTVPNGKTVRIHTLGGSGGCCTDTKIEIYWDTTCIFATHRDFERCGHNKAIEECVGNGTKKIKLLVTNDSSNDETMGGYFYGDEVPT